MKPRPLLPIFMLVCISVAAQRNLSKFEPADSSCLIVVGQDMEAIGGLCNYEDGYYNHFPRPAGFTIYTNFRPGDFSYGNDYQGCDGIFKKDSWGAGDLHANANLSDENFKDAVITIGLELVNHEGKVARGEHDSLVDVLGNWIRSLGRRPVFLRIGYEFDGHEWNHYNREDYIAAFRHIKDRYDAMHITNVAYVWQSKGWGTPAEEMEEWYPGDGYVDWCAYSWFANPDDQMIRFAQRHKKPVMIAESTPMFKETDTTMKETDFDNPQQAEEAWNKWFTPLFQTIRQYPETIKCLHYINCNWRTQPMWQTPPFNKIDARLNRSRMISENWVKEITQPNYLNASDDLWNLLYHEQ